jgi:hypothetical protein
MGTKTRRASAQILLRLEPAERDRVRAAIPRGSVNAVATQLLMDYVEMIEARSSRQHPEDPAA